MALSQKFGSTNISDEDVVEYRLFPLLDDTSLSDNQKIVFLQEKVDAYLAYLNRHCADYIWHKDPFRLRVQTTASTDNAPHHLYGRTCYGDNVEDEWFIVFLLIELSKEYSDVVIKIHDNDGEFLLIEAANHLPKWLNPETAFNRVFIYQGKMHVIPRPQTQDEVAMLSTGVPSVEDAVNYIRKQSTKTLADNGIQEDIHNRIAEYPEKKVENFHKTHCYIPASLAALLEESPSFIASIVDAFYHRDNVDLKACVTFRHFRPGTRVLRQVKFTRCLYAQLLQQKFQPDRRSGYTLPPSNNTKFKSYDLGMKLAHGAEILCSKYNGEEVIVDLLTERILKRSDIHSNMCRWECFFMALQKRGYFREEIAGSKLYLKLLDDAKSFYLATAIPPRPDDDVGALILSKIKSLNFDIEQMRQQEKDLLPPDDDSWIELNPEQLDEMLNKLSSDQHRQSNVFNLEKMSESMKSFVEKISSHEGAEFPKGDADEGDVQFDPNSFMQSMQKIFEFEDPESNSSSEMDEYESDDELGDSFAMKSKSKSSAKNNKKKKKKKNGEKEKEMKDYMEMMDKELSHTTIGQSFIKEGDEDDEISTNKPKPMPRKKKQQQQQQRVASVAAASGPSTSSSSQKKKPVNDDIDDEDDDFRPVNVDMNMVKNLLESYSSQQGQAGPTSNILGSMAFQLPQNSDDI